MLEKTPEHTNRLNSVNQKIVASGECLPVVELKDCSKVQTGTVAAMLHNIQLYNSGEREGVEQELTLAVPTLIKVGLFALFSPQEWIDGNNPGRCFVGQQAKDYLERLQLSKHK